jgi:hypothetical protein
MKELNQMIARADNLNTRQREFNRNRNNAVTRRKLFTNKYLINRRKREITAKLEKNPFNQGSNKYDEYVKCIQDGKFWHSDNKCSWYSEGSNADKCERAGGSWQGNRCD